MLTHSEGEDKRGGMIDLLFLKKVVCNATTRPASLECGNFELLVALRCAPGYSIAVSFNWLIKTPFACSPCPCPHTLTHVYPHKLVSVSGFARQFTPETCS